MSSTAPEPGQSGRAAALLQRLPEILVLLAMGGVAAWDGLRVAARTRIGAAEAGGWLVGVALLLIGFTILHALRLLRAKREALAVGKLGPIAFAATLLVLYSALMPALGYMLATALFTFGYLVRFGRYGAIRSGLGAAVFAVATAWIWAVLELQLPQGVIPWP